MMDVREEVVGKERNGDKCDQQDCRKTDPVLTDRHKRLVRLVTCFELASFAIKHGVKPAR
jgi:hypothetical protein